jgi:probable HAF family extracellular repeat protein
VTSCKAVLSLAVLLLASAPLALAQGGTWTQIDPPNSACFTYTSGIDSSGDIVGSYYDTTGFDHGFLMSGWVYTIFDYTAYLSNTAPTGINDVGQIVGLAYVSPDTFAFLYDVQMETYTILSDSKVEATKPACINNAGIIGGSVQISTDTFYGFALVGGTYRIISPPKQESSSVVGVTASNAFVGINRKTNGSPLLTFSYSQGKYSQIYLPQYTDLGVDGVNPQGTAFVGSYSPSLNVSAGFVFEKNTFTTLQFPGSSNTTPTGINRNGEVVGYFSDANNCLHGFTWTPPADAGKK